jgi:hypothetical protein
LGTVAIEGGRVDEDAAGSGDGFAFGGDTERVGAAAFAAGSTGGGATGRRSAATAHRAAPGGAAIAAFATTAFGRAHEAFGAGVVAATGGKKA